MTATNHTTAATETTMTAEAIDTDQIAHLTRAWRDLDLRRQDLVEQQDELRAKIRKLLAVGETVDVDGKPVRCQPNRRLDVDRAAALLTPAVRELCRADGYDGKKVRQYLPPALLDGCMVEVGEPKVVLA